MKTTILADLGQLQRLLNPSREDNLQEAMGEIGLFFSEAAPKLDVDASVFLDMMEQLTNDLSLVLDLPYASWSVEHPIDKEWSIRCQSSRIRNLIYYFVFVDKYNKKQTSRKEYDIFRWKERLPEKH